jgi:hypothetical protein
MTALVSGPLPVATVERDTGAASPTTTRSRWLARSPVRPVVADWPATGCDREEAPRVVLAASAALPDSRVRTNSHRGLPLLLDWLLAQPGASWQQRWLASGADEARAQWALGPAQWLRTRAIYSPSRLEVMTSTLLVAVGADLIRPSLAWLLTGGRKRKLARNMIRSRDGGGFERLRLLCDGDPAITPHARSQILFRVAVMIAAKGGAVSDITIGDVLEVLDLELALRGHSRGGAATFRVLRELGIFGDGVPTLREIRSSGQQPVEDLVDRYPIAYRPMRGLLIDYLKERQPAIDYVTLRGLTYQLVKCFWVDLERHHPGIDSPRLSREVAAAWKQRLRTRGTTTTTPTGQKVELTVERLSYLDTLATVRAFYLDLAEWALEDPSRWAAWVAPCPISQADLTRRAFVRRRKARMDARTRERLPVLPVLVRAADQWRANARALLTAARATTPGEAFTVAGHTLIRAVRPHADPTNVWVHDPVTGTRRLLNRDEDHAFWAWAIIEVFRHTGIRAEELQELSHHSLVQYRLPTSGELVPLLQIAPSKTDAERLLVVARNSPRSSAPSSAACATPPAPCRWSGPATGTN